MLPYIFARATVRVAGRSLSRTSPVCACRINISAPSYRVPSSQRPIIACLNGNAQRRCFASASSKSTADEIIEEITEQYATAKDEFEIAVEETEKNTVYAPDDRAAAGEEMAKLKDMYDKALSEQSEATAAEIKRRIGQRIRELDEAIKGLEESAKQGD